MPLDAINVNHQISAGPCLAFKYLCHLLFKILLSCSGQKETKVTKFSCSNSIPALRSKSAGAPAHSKTLARHAIIFGCLLRAKLGHSQGEPLIPGPLAILLRRLILARSAWRTRRAQLVWSQLSIAVLVEFLKRFRRLGNFVGGDGTVVIQIEHSDDRRWRPPPASRAARRAVRWRLIAALCKADGAAGGDKCCENQ